MQGWSSSMVIAAPTLADLSSTMRARIVPPAGRQQSAHLVGICGAGMKALAELLSSQGWRVTGSDAVLARRTSEVLLRRGLRVHQGHAVGHLPPDAQLLVYSPAVEESNPERQQALQLGIPQYSYSQMLGQLMASKIGISIAGTHGKSTTTAMTGCILTEAQLAPSVVFGAELREFRVSGWSGTGPHFVAESCEYQRSFLNLSPRLAAILSLEPDHFDCFSNFTETIDAFEQFARRLPEGGYLLIPEQSAAAKQASEQTVAEIETFSLQSTADWWASDIRRQGLGTRFRAFLRGEFFSEIWLQVPGTHNVLNALAAMALCHRAGLSAAAIRDGLAEFPGLKRRFEPLGSWRGVSLFDDYAHHPTEVRATLETAREMFPDRRIWCVFQPHQVSRTAALFDEFSRSFGAVNELLLTPIFAARETVDQEPAELSRQLTDAVRVQGVSARFSPSLDHTLATLDHDLRPGDVLFTMGAGDIGQIHYAFTRRLQRHHAAR